MVLNIRQYTSQDKPISRSPANANSEGETAGPRSNNTQILLFRSPMVSSLENGDYPPKISDGVHFADYNPIRQSGGCRCRLTEGTNGRGLVIHDVKSGIKPCNLHHVLDLLHEVEQLKFSTLLPHAGEGTDKMAQA